MGNVLFTTPSCPKCKLAQQLLDNAGINYTVSMNADDAVAMGIYTAPSLVMNGKILSFQDIILMCKGAGGNV